MTCIEARGRAQNLSAQPWRWTASIWCGTGRISDYGPNGAGKTTALNAVLGSLRIRGTEGVGRGPLERARSLMRDVCFIADVRRAAALDEGIADA